jgi:hypothetical protein
MRELADIVSAMPGCTKSDALRRAGLPTRGLGAGRSLSRAIDAGLILVEHERVNLCHLYASERDRQLWHLRRELLASPSADRAVEIVHRINAVRRERAATWVS